MHTCIKGINYNNSKMIIEWKHECHRCQAPLDIRVLAHTSTELLALSTFLKYFEHPDFEDNTSVFKCCGPRAHRVCRPCYDNIQMMKKHIHQSHMGKRPPILTPPVLTKGDLKEWFDQLEVFIECPLAEQFLTLNLKSYISASTCYDLV